MTILESLKEDVLEKFPNQIVYPNKTQDLLAYCEKNVNLITEAYELDLAEAGDRHTKMVISQHYYGNRRQTKNIELQVEQWIHTKLVEILIKNKNRIEKGHIENLFNLWKNVFEGKTSHENSQSLLEKLTINRASYSEFAPDPVDKVKTQKILEAANGITPSLGNAFHYRVDVLPQDAKDAMYPYMHGTFANCTQETRKEFGDNPHAYSEKEWRAKGICFNTQFEAPLILAYSIPTRIDGSPEHWRPNEFETSKDVTLVGVGLNMWNTICTVEDMGLNSCCLKAYHNKALEQIKVSSDETLPGDWQWQPYVFLCIGKGVRPKGDHRKYKPRGITNTLKIEAAA